MSRCKPVLFALLLLAACSPAGPAAPAATTAPLFAGDLRNTKYPGDSTAFKFETPAGLVIVVDPYMLNEDVAADIVTESHQHADHADTSRITGTYKLITTPGRFDEKGVSITGVPGHHNQGDQDVTNIVFVFDLG